MRHSNKHHHRQKDQKANKDLSWTMLTASCSLQQRTAACPTKYAPNCPQEESGNWGSTHSAPQHSWPFLAGWPHFLWQTTEQFARENTRHQYYLQQEKQGWWFCFWRALQLPAPIPALFSIGEVWKRGEEAGGDLEAQTLALQLSALHRWGQPCCNYPPRHHWHGISYSSGQKHQWGEAQH